MLRGVFYRHHLSERVGNCNLNSYLELSDEYDTEPLIIKRIEKIKENRAEAIAVINVLGEQRKNIIQTAFNNILDTMR